MASEEELLRIEELKKKLYSKNIHTSAVRDNNLHAHKENISTNWDDVDQKIKEEKEKDKKIKQEEESASGAGSLYDTGMGKGIYGHYSQAEQTNADKKPISTSVQSGSVEKKQSIGQFLSEKFSQDRAENTKKRLAAQDVTLKYAAAQAESSIYPNLGKKENPVPIESAGVEEKETEPKPEIHIYRVGDRSLETLNKDFKPHAAEQKPLTKTQQELVRAQKVEKVKRLTFGSVLFTFVLLFFVGALGYAYIHFERGTNVISPDKIDIKVTGPVSVVSGEVSEFLVDITNNNSAELIQADLVVQYPDGTKNPEDRTLNLNNQRIDIGEVPAGQTVRRKLSAVFFGEQNLKKNIMYSFEFNIADSTNIFSKDKKVGITIAGSPLTTKITNVKEITNNKELVFDVEVVSNSSEPIKNVQLKVEYPFGYKLTESNIKPVGDNNIWNIGDIEALGARTIKLKGVLIGTSNLDKNFRFTLGVSDPKTGQMSTVIATQDQKVSIKDPFVLTTLDLDGTVSGPLAVKYGDGLRGNIVIVNNLKNTLTDVVVEMRLAGTLIDRTKVAPDGGFYRSSDDIVFWDQSQKTELAVIEPGQRRDLSFNVDVIKSRDDLVNIMRRAGSSFVITVKAKRLNENNVPEEITYDTSRELRLMTDLALESYIEHVSGPVPTKVNTETTFRYVGRITNTANAVKGTVFTAKLPPNATWKNKYSSNINAKSIYFNTAKREITIQMGEIPAGTGSEQKPVEFYFEFGFTPSLVQKESEPVVLIGPRIDATDSFTQTTISGGVDGITTAGQGGGQVVE